MRREHPTLLENLTQFEHLTGATWPLPFLLRPLLARFLTMVAIALLFFEKLTRPSILKYVLAKTVISAEFVPLLSRPRGNQKFGGTSLNNANQRDL